MGLKIPRSKGRAGSIPASGTKQIKGLHEILHAGPLFFAPRFLKLFRNSRFCPLSLGVLPNEHKPNPPVSPGIIFGIFCSVFVVNLNPP